MTAAHIKRTVVILTLLLSLTATVASAEELTFSGQASGWLLYEENNTDKFQLGLRYIPELAFKMPLPGDEAIDGALALNAYTTAPVNSLEEADINEEIRPYRAWLRYKTAQSELRVGLQKINFGAAKVLRSIKWFDHIDPNDPLELTDGVTALLGRHYFLDNSNIWLWCVREDGRKGLELYETKSGATEFGGRFQLAVPHGEAAFSYNRRRIESDAWNAKNPTPLTDGTENRYAIDAAFDITVGAWFEASAEQLQVTHSTDEWRNMTTLGVDYTLKSGIYLMYEYYLHSTGTAIDRTGETGELSAFMAQYSMTMIDSLRGILYYDHNATKGYHYLDYQRTYDDWQINIAAFRNAKSGTGMQCMLTYNH